jgi:adenine-specific DNA-methyltransferase
MKLVRNTGTDRVIDLLRPELTEGRQLDVVTPDFSLFAFAEMLHEMAGLTRCRLLLPPTSADLAVLGSGADRAARNRLHTRWLAGRLTQWLVGHTQAATTELKGLFDGKQVFDSPKPVKLLKRILEIGCSAPNDLVLDFFAGSGTTAHACYTKAAEGAPGRFMLVQLPEPIDDGSFGNIAEITKERLRRAGKKIRDENPTFAGDLGFRVFKLDTSNIQAWDPDRKDIAASLEAHAKNLKVDRTEQDILFELLLKLGLDLTVPILQRTIARKTVHSIGGGVLLVCLASYIIQAEAEPVALGLAAWHKEQAPAGESTVVFRDSAFADDVAKTNLAAILNQHGLQNVRSL